MYLQITLVLCAVYLTGILAFGNDRIVGGRPAKLNEYPYQVSLRHSFNDEHFCGGSVISPCHILTAATCMLDARGGILPPSTVSVVGGQTGLELTENSIWRNASKIYVHEKFDENLRLNDIAIVELTKCFHLDGNQIAYVPLNTRIPGGGTPCVVSGWGITKTGDQKLSDELLSANLYIIDKTVCQNMYSKANVELSHSMMCAGDSNGVKEACQGDTGGPLICNFELVGVVLTTTGCANVDYPGIYTDVSLYYSWIKKILNGINNRRF